MRAMSSYNLVHLVQVLVFDVIDDWYPQIAPPNVRVPIADYGHDDSDPMNVHYDT